MGKSELLDKVSKLTGQEREICSKVYDAIVETILVSLSEEETVKLKGFATFEVAEQPAKRRRDPSDGEVKLFPASKHVVCKPSKTMKEVIKWV